MKYNYESDKVLCFVIILVVVDDNWILVLEIFEKYFIEEMYIDVGKINEIVEKFKDIIGNLGKLFN